LANLDHPSYVVGKVDGKRPKDVKMLTMDKTTIKTKGWTEQEDLYLRENYQSMSHEDIGLKIQRTEKSVRNRCWRLKLTKRENWTHDEVVYLKSIYGATQNDNVIDLDQVASKLGKLKSNISRKARDLGLTNQCRKRVVAPKIRPRKFATQEEVRQFMSMTAKKRIAEKGHPRGALGMKHTEKTKALLSQKTKQFNDSLTQQQKQDHLVKAAKTKMANGTYAMPRHKTTWKASWREIGDKRKFYRSRWEANYARFLEFLKVNNKIADWQHEPKVFWFEGIKRGVVSYLPDFCVKELDGSESYHEVKGWMDDRSKTKIKRMAKYHPEVKLIVIDSKAYNELQKKISHLIPQWES
jgi:hypothetical protein